MYDAYLFLVSRTFKRNYGRELHWLFERKANGKAS